MASYGSGQYKSDPGKQRAAQEFLRGLVAKFKGVHDEFLVDGKADSVTGRPWYGWDDEFAEQVGPQYEEIFRNLSESGLSAAVVAMIEALLATDKLVSQPQGHALDEIGKVGSASGHTFGGGSGKK